MRKDTIEERITGIEKDMKELRSEIRQELRSMISELKEFQTLVVEDRAAEIQDALSREYRQIAYENNIVEADRKFRAQMSADCPPDERSGCIDDLVDKHLRSDIMSLDNASPETAGQTLESIRNQDDVYCARFKGTNCEECMKLYKSEHDRLLDMGARFTRYRKSLSTRGNGLYFQQLPDDLAVSEIVEPLSHKARFAMLKSLTSGDRTYKELGEITGYTGGHLLYHLNKLTDAGLAEKEEKKGLYRITEKGTGVMEIVKKMYAQ
jgi:DNA-binding transcriptional ArsR family regulator